MKTYSDTNDPSPADGESRIEFTQGWQTLDELKHEWQEQACNRLLNEVDEALRDPELCQRLDLGPEHMRVVERVRIYVAGSFSSEERSS